MTNEDAIKWIVNLKTDIGNPHYERLWPYAQALDEIGEMLKKQEPVKPDYDPTTLEWSCGNCGQSFDRCKYKYCPVCGRAVKWND